MLKAGSGTGFCDPPALLSLRTVRQALLHACLAPYKPVLPCRCSECSPIHPGRPCACATVIVVFHPLPGLSSLSALDRWLSQVHEQVSAALEAHSSTHGVERFESQSSLAFGDSAPVDGPPVCASVTQPAAPTVGVPPAQPPLASLDADAPDLIDFGDDPPPEQPAQLPLNASQGPLGDAPAKLPDSESQSPVAVGPAESNGADLNPGAESVDDLAQGVQAHVKVDTEQSDNPFA